MVQPLIRGLVNRWKLSVPLELKQRAITTVHIQLPSNYNVAIWACSVSCARYPQRLRAIGSRPISCGEAVSHFPHPKKELTGWRVGRPSRPTTTGPTIIMKYLNQQSIYTNTFTFFFVFANLFHHDSSIDYSPARQPASYGKKNGTWYASPGNQGWGTGSRLSRKPSVTEVDNMPSGSLKPSAGRVIRIINSHDHSVQVSMDDFLDGILVWYSKGLSIYHVDSGGGGGR